MIKIFSSHLFPTGCTLLLGREFNWGCEGEEAAAVKHLSLAPQCDYQSHAWLSLPSTCRPFYLLPFSNNISRAFFFIIRVRRLFCQQPGRENEEGKQSLQLLLTEARIPLHRHVVLFNRLIQALHRVGCLQLASFCSWEACEAATQAGPKSSVM